MSVTQRSNRFRGTGRILSIQPSSGTPTTEFESYQIQSEGLPASEIHSVNPILKPGTSTALDTNAVFFEPTETYRDNSDAPIYSQLVINTNSSDFSTELKISEYEEYFTVTDPGSMYVTKFSYTTVGSGGSGGAGDIISRPKELPKQRRKQATVEVYLTESDEALDEVAYTNNVEWCSITFSNIFQQESTKATSVNGSFQSFNQYLVGTDAEANGFVPLASVDGGGNVTYPAVVLDTGISGETFSTAKALGRGAVTYVTSGLYRSKVEPFMRQSDGTQLYLRTDVKFD